MGFGNLETENSLIDEISRLVEINSQQCAQNCIEAAATLESLAKKLEELAALRKNSRTSAHLRLAGAGHLIVWGK